MDQISGEELKSKEAETERSCRRLQSVLLEHKTSNFTRGLKLHFQHGSSVPAHDPPNIGPDAPATDQKPVQNKKNIFAVLLGTHNNNQACTLRKKFSSAIITFSSVHSSKQTKICSSKSRLASSKYTPPVTEFSQAHIVIAPTIGIASWPLQSSSDMTYLNTGSSKTTPECCSKSKSVLPQKHPDPSKFSDSDSRKTSLEQISQLKSASPQKYPDSSKSPTMKDSNSVSNKTFPERCSKSKSASPQKYPDSSKSRIMNSNSVSNKTSPERYSKWKSASPQKYPDSSKSPILKDSNSVSNKTSPDLCSKSKSASPQKYPAPSKSPDMKLPDMKDFHSRSNKTSPERCSKLKSESPYPNRSKSPCIKYSNSRSNKKNPERCSNSKSASPQNHSHPTKSSDMKDSNSGCRKTSPSRCSKTNSESPQKQPDPSKSPGMKISNSGFSKTSPDRCSNSKSATPEKYANSSNLSAQAPNKSDSAQSCLLPLHKYMRKKSSKIPLNRKVRYKISTTKSHVKFSVAKPKINKHKESIANSLVRNIDVLYLTELNCLVEKFINSLTGPYATCPALKERLQKHRLKCPVRPAVGSTLAQTKVTLANTGELFNCCHKNGGAISKRKEFNDIRMASITDTIKTWLNKIPQIRDTPVEATSKAAAVQELFESIISIENTDVDDNDYVRLVYNAADCYLNQIHIWYPGTKRDKISLKNGLKKYLIHKLLQNRKKYPQKSQMVDKRPHIETYDKNRPSINVSAKPCCDLNKKISHTGSINKISQSTFDCKSNSYVKSQYLESEANSKNRQILANRRPDMNLETNRLDGNEKNNLAEYPGCNDLDESIRKCNYSPEANNKNYTDGHPNDGSRATFSPGEVHKQCQRDDVDPHEKESARKISSLDINRSLVLQKLHDPDPKNILAGSDKCRSVRNGHCINFHNEKVTKNRRFAPVKNLLVSDDLCICSEKSQSTKIEIGGQKIDIEKEIDEWLKHCTLFLNNDDSSFNKSVVKDALLLNLRPYFNLPYEVLSKPVWKKKIIKIMKDVKVCTYDSHSKQMVARFADDLANRFIGILSRLQCAGGSRWNCDLLNKRPFKDSEEVTIGPITVLKKDLRHDLMLHVDEYLQSTRLAYDRQIKETILNLLIDNIELIRNDLDIEIKNNIMNILKETKELTDVETENLVENILHSCKVLTMMISNVNNKTGYNTTIVARPCLSGTVSILTSQNDMTPSFDAISSTPKKRTKIQRPSQLNREQQAYTENVEMVIKSWVDSSPPHFKFRKGSENMTEQMVEDLGAEICDHLRVEQIIDRYTDKEQVITFYVYKWLMKYDIIEDLKLAESYTKELVKKIDQITVPNMTRPQHGNRQDIEMIKQAANETWTEAYHPQVKDVLEDEISIFMNEYPSEIFVDKDKNTRGKTVHQFAEKIQPKLVDAHSGKDVKQEVHRWMNIVVEPRERDRVGDMAQSLIKRLKRVPHDETLAKYAQCTKKERQRKKQEKYQKVEKQKFKEQGVVPPSTQAHNISEVDCDKTMAQFVAEYIEHYHVEEDLMTKNMYAQILKSELNRLNPYALKEVYENKKHEQFDSEKLNKELMYIKEVSDWLKTIPMDSFYNTVENKDRAEFVIGVAKNIIEVEEERQSAPDAMDYDLYLGHNIAELFGTLPILPSHRDIAQNAVDELLHRLAIMRGDIQPTPPGESILQFIEEFMKRHGPEIADDKLRLEAWSARLLKELKKILIEGEVREKEGFEHRLLLIPKPGDESVRHFNLELNYAKEIVDWLKNLELRGSFDESNIEELAYKMADQKIHDPENELRKTAIIHDWVKRLSSNKNEDVHISLLTRQLVNRIEKVSEEDDLNVIKSVDISVKPNTSKMRDKVTRKENCRKCCPIDDPGELIVCIVEQWNNELPLEGNDKNVRQFKEMANAKLYQKIAELSDAHIYKSNRVMFERCLADEIGSLFNNIPLDLKMKGNMEDLIKKLMEKVLMACAFISDISAADNYRKELENAIQNLLPKPGLIDRNLEFDLLKEHIVDKFILDNFDHGNNTKYKNTIQRHIDKYPEIIQKLNAVPIDNKKQIESVYSTLYNVEIPNLEALKENVEEVKTKCEIEEWFEALPLEPSDLVNQLRRNEKFMGLARKLRAYELEKASSEKVHNEIKTFLQKELQQPGIEENIKKYAKDLQDQLKSTENSRKFTKPHKISFKSSDKNESHIVYSIETIGPNTEQEITKPADIVIDKVEKWCETVVLSLNISAEQLKGVRNNLESKIIMKVCELNSSPTTLNSDLLYTYLLDQNVRKYLVYFGIAPDEKLISELVSAIESTRLLFIEEISRYAYKKELENTVDRFLEIPQNPKPKDKVMYGEIKDSIINYFLEYQCHKHNEEGKHRYKDKIVEALTKHYHKFKGGDIGNIRADCLIEGNRLICELCNIIEPSDIVISEEIAENRMKQEVNKFLKEQKISINNINQSFELKTKLTRDLTELEKSGHNQENDEKIRAAVNSNLKKQGATVSSSKVKVFVDRLKENEKSRKNIRLNKREPRNLSLPTDLNEPNPSQYFSSQKSLPISFRDGQTTQSPQSPISMPKMIPFPPTALPEGSVANNDFSAQVTQQDGNVNTISGPPMTRPRSLPFSQTAQGTGVLPFPKPPQDSPIPQTLPQFQRYPPLALLEESKQSGAQLVQQDISERMHIPPTQRSPIQNSPIGDNVQLIPPQDSPIPQKLPQFQRYPPLTVQEDNISTLHYTQPSVQGLQQDVPANMNISPTQRSPIQHSTVQDNVQPIPPQDSPIPQKLPQFQRYPPLTVQEDTISTLHYTQPNVQVLQQDVPANMNISPTQRSPIQHSPLGGNMQPLPPHDSPIPQKLPQFQRYPPLTVQENTISTLHYTQPSAQLIQHDVPASMNNSHTQSSPIQHSPVQDNMQPIPPQDSPIPQKVPQFQRYPPLTVQEDNISTLHYTQPSVQVLQQDVPANMNISPTQRSPIQNSPIGDNVQPIPPQDSPIPQKLPQFQRYPPLTVQEDNISTLHYTQPSVQVLQQDVPANMNISPMQRSPIQHSPLGGNVQPIPPQDSPIPQTLPQIRRYPPLNFQEDTISSLNSTHASARLAQQDTVMQDPSVQGPPTQPSPISEHSVTTWNSSDSGPRLVHQDVCIDINAQLPPHSLPPDAQSQIPPPQMVSSRTGSQTRTQMDPSGISHHLDPLSQPQPVQSLGSSHLRVPISIPGVQGRSPYSVSSNQDLTQPSTRSLGVTFKPPTSDAGVQMSAPQYIPVPYMALPLPPGLRLPQNLGNVESPNDGKPQRAQLEDIDCDCEHCMEGLECLGFPPDLYSSSESLRPCFPPAGLWMPPCLGMPPFNSY